MAHVCHLRVTCVVVITYSWALQANPRQGLIEPPKAARGHVTSVNGKIQNNIIYRTSLLLLATPDVRKIRGARSDNKPTTASVDNSAYHCRLLAFQFSPVNSDELHHSVVTVVCEAYGTCELRPRLARQMVTSLPAGDPWMAYYTQSVTVLRTSSPQSPSIRIAGFRQYSGKIRIIASFFTIRLY